MVSCRECRAAIQINDNLEAVAKMTELLAEVVILNMGIHPLARYLDSRIFSFRGAYKAVLGTTFNGNHVLLFSLVPTNTGERKPKAIPGIAPNVDKDHMFFVSHSRFDSTA